MHFYSAQYLLQVNSLGAERNFKNCRICSFLFTLTHIGARAPISHRRHTATLDGPICAGSARGAWPGLTPLPFTQERSQPKTWRPSGRLLGHFLASLEPYRLANKAFFGMPFFRFIRASPQPGAESCPRSVDLHRQDSAIRSRGDCWEVHDRVLD